MTKQIIPTVPTNAIVSAVRAALNGATLDNIATIAGDAGAALGRMANTAISLRGTVVEATLRVVGREAISDVLEPLKLTISNTGKHVPNLSTIRTATLKMLVTYGASHALPIWLKVSEAKDSGDAALTASIAACYNFDSEGKATLQESTRDDLLERINSACATFGLSEDSQGKIRGQYFAAMQEMAESGEPVELSDDEKIVAEQNQALQSELAQLRIIAIEARRVLGVSVDTPNDEFIAELATLEVSEG